MEWEMLLPVSLQHRMKQSITNVKILILNGQHYESDIICIVISEITSLQLMP